MTTKEALDLITEIHNELSINLDARYQVDNNDLLSSEEINKLKSLGFNESVFDAQIVNPSLAKKRDLYLKYKEKAPNYKFISDDDIIELCSKYNLVIGSNQLYKEKIPKRVIQSILNFKVLDNNILIKNDLKLNINNNKLFLTIGDINWKLYKNNNEYFYLNYTSSRTENEFINRFTKKERRNKYLNNYEKIELTKLVDYLNSLSPNSYALKRYEKIRNENLLGKYINYETLTTSIFGHKYNFYLSESIVVDIKPKTIINAIKDGINYCYDYFNERIHHHITKVDIDKLNLNQSQFYFLAPIEHFNFNDEYHKLKDNHIIYNLDKLVDELNISTYEIEYNKYQEEQERLRIKAILDDDPALLVKVDGGYLIVDLWGKEAYLEKLQNAELN